MRSQVRLDRLFVVVHARVRSRQDLLRQTCVPVQQLVQPRSQELIHHRLAAQAPDAGGLVRPYLEPERIETKKDNYDKKRKATAASMHEPFAEANIAGEFDRVDKKDGATHFELGPHPRYFRVRQPLRLFELMEEAERLGQVHFVNEIATAEATTFAVDWDGGPDPFSSAAAITPAALVQRFLVQEAGVEEANAEAVVCTSETKQPGTWYGRLVWPQVPLTAEDGMRLSRALQAYLARHMPDVEWRSVVDAEAAFRRLSLRMPTADKWDGRAGRPEGRPLRVLGALHPDGTLDPGAFREMPLRRVLRMCSRRLDNVPGCDWEKRLLKISDKLPKELAGSLPMRSRGEPGGTVPAELAALVESEARRMFSRELGPGVRFTRFSRAPW